MWSDLGGGFTREFGVTLGQHIGTAPGKLESTRDLSLLAVLSNVGFGQHSHGI